MRPGRGRGPGHLSHTSATIQVHPQAARWQSDPSHRAMRPGGIVGRLGPPSPSHLGDASRQLDLAHTGTARRPRTQARTFRTCGRRRAHTPGLGPDRPRRRGSRLPNRRGRRAPLSQGRRRRQRRRRRRRGGGGGGGGHLAEDEGDEAVRVVLQQAVEVHGALRGPAARAGPACRAAGGGG